MTVERVGGTCRATLCPRPFRERVMPRLCPFSVRERYPRLLWCGALRRLCATTSDRPRWALRSHTALR